MDGIRGSDCEGGAGLGAPVRCGNGCYQSGLYVLLLVSGRAHDDGLLSIVTPITI